MRDVTVSTGIKWSYGVQQSQISGPAWIQSDHFDIDAKADEPATDAQMKLMLQALLADRFKLTFHRENREVRGYAMTVGKGGTKLHPAVGDGVMQRENSANGTVARNITLQEFADFIAGPLEAPVVNKTGLEGKYDLTLDFTSYLPPEERAMKPDFLNIVMAALQGELGLKLESQKVTVAVMVVDRVEKPSEN